MFSSELSSFAKLIYPKNAESIWQDDHGFDWSKATPSTLVKRLDGIEWISPQEYRLALPMVLMALESNAKGLESSNEVAQFLGLPVLEFELRNGQHPTFLESIRLENLVVPGWVAPTFSALSYDELNKCYLAIEAELQEIQAKETGYFEEELEGFLGMLEMSIK